jgi:hypothetical protein
VLGAVAIAGTAALRHRLDQRALLQHFRASVAERLNRGEFAGAFQLLDEACAADPKQAWLYQLLFTARFNHIWYERQAGAVDILHALDESPSAAPAPPSPARYPEPLAGKVDGLAEILYVAGPASSPYSSFFPDAAAMLGKASVDLSVTTPAQAWQHVVVAPQEDLAVPLGAASALFLGPNQDAERALGLRRRERRRVESCVLKSDDPAMAPLSTFAVEVPFDGDVAVYDGTSGLDVLARIDCPTGRYPGLLASRTKPRRLLFTFSLPALVVRLRQGDSRLAGKETDGVPGVRASDLFSRRRTLEELAVPEADLLLASVLSLIEEGAPAVRLWPHPAGTLSTLITTSDQDFENESHIRILTSALARLGTAPTIYLTSDTHQAYDNVATTDPSPAFVRTTAASGVDYGPHTYFYPWGDRLPDQHPRAPESVLGEHRDRLRAHYGLEPLSVRFHYVQWWGYVDPIRAEAAAGYRYDLNFLTMHSDVLGGLGYMTGSGFPLHFYDEAGQPLPVRQLATQLDDHANPYAVGVPFAKIERVRFMDATRDLVSLSAERFHSPLVVNNHPVHFFADPDWLISLISRARQEHVATLNVASYDAFLHGLTESRYRRLDAHRIHLSILNEWQDLLLLNTAGPIEIDDHPAQARREKRYGQDVLVATLARGHHTLVLP